MHLKPHVIILCVGISLLATDAFCAPAKWSLKNGAVAKYRIETQKAAADKQRDLLMPAGFPITPADISDGLRVDLPAKDLQSVIIRQVLSLPRGMKSSKGSFPVSDSMKSVGNHVLNIMAKGVVKTKKSGRRFKMQGQMELTQGAASKRSKITSGSLQWISQFDSKKGVFVSINYQFSLTYTFDSLKGKITNHAFVSKGQFALAKLKQLKGKEYRSNLAKAIASGAGWLKKHSSKSLKAKTRMGVIALNVFALLRSGVPANDPDIVKAFEVLEAQTPTLVYDVSLYIMALEAKTVRRVAPKGTRSVPRYERGKVARADMKKIQGLANWLVMGRIEGFGRWHYTAHSSEGEESKGAEAAGYDNSVTQFAVLALHAAHRAGAKIDARVWKEIFEHFLKSQSPSIGAGVHTIGRSNQLTAKEEKIGSGMTTVERQAPVTEGEEGIEYRGWSYKTGTAYGSMTNAGLSSVAIAADMLKAEGKFPDAWESEFQRMVAQGLSWQAKHYTVKTNPGKGGDAWHFYYLYSLEKACELLDVESFDKHKWHDDGSKYLITVQQTNGSWHNQDRDTALALLFLNRATLKTTVNILKRRSTTGGGDAPRDMAVVYIDEAEGEVSLNNLLSSMVDASTPQRKKLQRWFKIGLAHLAEVQRPVVIPALSAMLDFKRVKRFARSQLRQITRDSALKTSEDHLKWHARWEVLHKAGLSHRYQDIPKLRAGLEDPNILLRKQTMLSAIRLGAVELVPDIIKLVDQPHDKEDALQCLSSLTSTSAESKEELQKWADTQLAARLRKEMPKRLVYLAVYGSKSARKKLVKNGKAHMPKLIQLAARVPYSNGAMEVLEQISGQRFLNAKAWSEWFEKNQKDIDPSGRLKKTP